MPGVFRPNNLVDVLGALNQQTTGLVGSQATVNGLGQFGEVNETMTLTDTVTTSLQTPAVWDSGQWGSFTWG